MPQPPSKPLPHDPRNPYVLVPLHQYPEFTFPCATLLNMEWPRSRQSRLNSLWSCSRSFPVAMVLVKSDVREAVGFCKISLVPSHKNTCFVESVVVHPDLRGKGLGSLLMKKLEQYVMSRKLNTIYLSTLGQEKFYKKLGYDECAPVSLYAFGLNAQTQLPRVVNECGSLKEDCSDEKSLSEKSNSFSNTGNVNSNNKQNCFPPSSHLPPPPPPPLPAIPLGEGVMTAKTYMKKELK